MLMIGYMDEISGKAVAYGNVDASMLCDNGRNIALPMNRLLRRLIEMGPKAVELVHMHGLNSAYRKACGRPLQLGGVELPLWKDETARSMSPRELDDGLAEAGSAMLVGRCLWLGRRSDGRWSLLGVAVGSGRGWLETRPDRLPLLASGDWMRSDALRQPSASLEAWSRCTERGSWKLRALKWLAAYACFAYFSPEDADVARKLVGSRVGGSAGLSLLRGNLESRPALQLQQDVLDVLDCCRRGASVPPSGERAAALGSGRALAMELDCSSPSGLAGAELDSEGGLLL